MKTSRISKRDFQSQTFVITGIGACCDQQRSLKTAISKVLLKGN